MILKHNVIFLDTNVFQSENFTEGLKLNQLLKQAKEHNIQIKIVDIVYEECQKRMHVKVGEAKTAFKKSRAQLNNEGRVLRTLSNYKDFFRIPKVEIDQDFEKIKTIFDNFLKANNIEIVNSNIADHNEVLRMYFDKKAPFGTGQKKSEFPDAFIINTIQKWSKLNYIGSYVISSDTGMIDCKSQNLEIIPSISEMSEIIVHASKLYDEVSDILADNIGIALDDLEKSIGSYSDDLSLLIYEKLLEDPTYVDLEYEPGKVLNISRNSLGFTSLEENLLQLELRTNIEIQIPMDYKDTSMAVRDREDDILWNIMYVKDTSIYKMDLLLSLEFEYEIEDGKILNFDFVSINNFYLVDYEKIIVNMQERSEFEDW